ncbi:MAG TPA: hypothetical protein PKV67_01185 [Hyphomonas sp.]|nr:hypothetical protein [Hyphomonas sp.]
MTRALPLTERQARTLLRAADKERGIVEVKIGDTFVRLIPESRSQQERPIDEERNPETFETLDDYLAWRDRKHARENQGHS